jgi:L,D-transpeptidase YbiS
MFFKQWSRGSLVVIAMTALCLSGCKNAAQTQFSTGQNNKKVDLATMRSQVQSLEVKVGKLEASLNRAYPGGPVILVDTSKSKISLMVGARVIVEGTCSTGNGMELADKAGKRNWTFDTPRGHFQVIGKVANPVWYRPDWSYVEEGEPIPKNYAERATANVLGDYAIGFGDGFYIHGTLYTRLLGVNVTHGCIRVDDKVLKKLFAAATPGTHIWIY